MNGFVLQAANASGDEGEGPHYTRAQVPATDLHACQNATALGTVLYSNAFFKKSVGKVPPWGEYYSQGDSQL